MQHYFCLVRLFNCIQGDHLSGKPENVSKFDSCQEMSGILLSQGSVREKILSAKSDLKLFIVSCIVASFLDFGEHLHFTLVSDHALLHSYPHRTVREMSRNCQGISHCLERGHSMSKT